MAPFSCKWQPENVWTACIIRTRQTVRFCLNRGQTLLACLNPLKRQRFRPGSDSSPPSYAACIGRFTGHPSDRFSVATLDPMAIRLLGAAAAVAGPKGPAEFTEEPRLLLGRGVGHAPAGRPRSVVRLPQGYSPRRRQIGRLELIPMGRPEAYPTNPAFANTIWARADGAGLSARPLTAEGAENAEERLRNNDNDSGEQRAHAKTPREKLRACCCVVFPLRLCVRPLLFLFCLSFFLCVLCGSRFGRTSTTGGGRRAGGTVTRCGVAVHRPRTATRKAA